MNRERIEETVRLWQAEPDKAKGKPAVKARAEGSQAAMEHGSFSWRTDLPAPLGGANEAPSPTALVERPSRLRGRFHSRHAGTATRRPR